MSPFEIDFSCSVSLGWWAFLSAQPGSGNALQEELPPLLEVGPGRPHGRLPPLPVGRLGVEGFRGFRIEGYIGLIGFFWVYRVLGFSRVYRAFRVLT